MSLEIKSTFPWSRFTVDLQSSRLYVLNQLWIFVRRPKFIWTMHLLWLIMNSLRWTPVGITESVTSRGNSDDSTFSFTQLTWPDREGGGGQRDRSHPFKIGPWDSICINIRLYNCRCFQHSSVSIQEETDSPTIKYYMKGVSQLVLTEVSPFQKSVKNSVTLISLFMQKENYIVKTPLMCLSTTITVSVNISKETRNISNHVGKRLFLRYIFTLFIHKDITSN